MRPERISTKKIFDGVILHVRKDIAMMSDLQIEREVVEHPGGVGIALQKDDGTFFFVRQYRYAVDEFTLEYPAGKKEVGEDHLKTAQREIMEETGYEGIDWKYLGKIYPTPAYDTEVIDMYYARCGRFVGQHLDIDEEIQLESHSLDEMAEMILAGKIPDAKTVAMTFYLIQLKNKGEI